MKLFGTDGIRGEVGVEPINKLPILQSLDSAGHKIKDFTLEEPNLEDAFMKLTGEDEK